ncbi:primase-helicase family protein [Photobacterium damselae subsp. damselae]|uniref:primase-helicase family protein n=1 Tax=Photobacterium damselae TaxID=38293 RepID=UPI00311AD1F4
MTNVVPIQATTKEEKKDIPAEIKEYIQRLKSLSVCKITDQNKGFLIYIPQDDSKQPDLILNSYFYECYPKCGVDYSDYSGYVLASLPLVVGQYFKPCNEKYIQRGIAKRLNKYKPYVPSTNAYKPPALFIELLQRLIPEPAENKYFTQWLAHLVQRPAQRPSVAVMLTSEEGTGKGQLYHRFIRPLCVNQTAQVSSYSELMGSHSTALADTLFVMLDDIKSNSDSTITRLKSKISEPTALINPKNQQEYIQDVYARILLASNETRPIKLSKDDLRRWFVPNFITHKISKEETREFFNRVFAWLDNPSNFALDNVYMYLANYDLSGFDPFYVEPTETLLNMTELSTSYLESQVRELMDRLCVFKLDSFLQQEQWRGKEDLVKTYVVNYWKKPRKVELEKGKGRSNWWVKPDLTNAQAKELYNLN